MCGIIIVLSRLYDGLHSFVSYVKTIIQTEMTNKGEFHKQILIRIPNIINHNVKTLQFFTIGFHRTFLLHPPQDVPHRW